MSKIEQLKELGWTTRDIAILLKELMDGLDYLKEDGKKDVFEGSQEKKVMELLKSLGYPIQVNGFRYVKMAILYCMEKNIADILITKELYPVIAEKYRTTVKNVEHSIRHGVECMFRENSPMVEQVFGKYINEKRRVSNSSFIAILVEYLKYS